MGLRSKRKLVDVRLSFYSPKDKALVLDAATKLGYTLQQYVMYCVHKTTLEAYQGATHAGDESRGDTDESSGSQDVPSSETRTGSEPSA